MKSTDLKDFNLKKQTNKLTTSKICLKLNAGILSAPNGGAFFEK